MKNLYLIGGTMGVGKTTVCQKLKTKLTNCVFLDGDWCWDAHPFQVTEETKKMVLQNICFLLNSFIHCSAYENILFCWVMHEQSIIDAILADIDKTNCSIRIVSLVCNEQALRSRLDQDIANGLRSEDVIARSISRLPYYQNLNTIKIDVSTKDADEIACEIADL